MSATPPEAKPEYSRADGPSRGVYDAETEGSRTPRGPGSGGPGLAVQAVGALGAALLIVAEFTTLFTVRSAASAGPVASDGTGAHHAYAMIPIALLALVLIAAARRGGGRTGWAALAALGLIALLIVLIRDFPDAHSAGLVGSAATHFTNATSNPGTGLYLETLGAVALLLAGGVGWLMGRPAPVRTRRARND